MKIEAQWLFGFLKIFSLASQIFLKSTEDFSGCYKQQFGGHGYLSFLDDCYPLEWPGSIEGW